MIIVVPINILDVIIHLLWGSDGKESACNAGDMGSIPGSGRSPGEGNGNPLQDSCLGNPMGRGGWQVDSPRGHKESHRTEQLNICLCVSGLFDKLKNKKIEGKIPA